VLVRIIFLESFRFALTGWYTEKGLDVSCVFERNMNCDDGGDLIIYKMEEERHWTSLRDVFCRQNAFGREKEKNAKRSFFHTETRMNAWLVQITTCRNQLYPSCGRRNIPREYPSAWHGYSQSSQVRYPSRSEACSKIVVRKNLKGQRPAWEPLRELGFR
jgi:hypothetical protein